MKIFLSYASQDFESAKAIYLALRDQGHRVFFDRTELPAGDEYHNHIRIAVENSRLFLFLISPNAIDAGSYTLTELDIAEKAGSKILPVMLEKTPIEALPASIKGITFLQPDGNLPAAVAAEVHRIGSSFRRKRIKQTVAALLLAGIVATLVFFAMRMRSRTEIVGTDGAPAALIPTGTFIMGDDEESPRREIFLDAFYLDRYEVTVARYAAFMKDTGNLKSPDQWDTVDLKNGGDLPVIGVNWQDASSYCRWAGRRLPTEAEWEKAARGGDRRVFPWGAPGFDRAVGVANIADVFARREFPTWPVSGSYEDGAVATAPRHSYPRGASPYGAEDMIGNVEEWTLGWYDRPALLRSIRGASWHRASEHARISHRYPSEPASHPDYGGFRCVAPGSP